MLYRAAAKLTGVDRGALLSITNEMEQWARTCDLCGRRVSPMDVLRYARRIREALGGVGIMRLRVSETMGAIVMLVVAFRPRS